MDKRKIIKICKDGKTKEIEGLGQNAMQEM